MPSEEEVVKSGINVAEMNVLLTKKVEELTLYLIEKDKSEKELRDSQKQLKDRLDEQQALIIKLNSIVQELGKSGKPASNKKN
jgi:hypothetical protein